MSRGLSLFLVVVVALGAAAQDPPPHTAERHFAEGLTFLRQGAFDKAVASFEKSAALDGKQPATFANLGAAFLALKSYVKAEISFGSAINLAPNEGSFHTNLCQALSLQKKHSAAISACEEGVRLAPGSDAAHVGKIAALEQSGSSDENLRQLVYALLGRFPTSEMVWALAADRAMADRNFADAARFLEELVSRHPMFSMYRGLLAEAYLRLDRDVDSLASARAALKLDPDNPYANYSMGLIFFELGQHDEAVESFSKVKINNRHLNYARYYLAVSNARRGKTLDAVVILRELVSEHPENLDFIAEYADNLRKLSRFAETEEIYERAIRLDPTNPFFHSGLGMSFMMRGIFDKAKIHFEEAFRLKPDEPIYRMFLNVSRGRQSLVPQIPQIIKEVDARPKDLNRRVDLARILAFEGDFDAAHDQIKIIYAMNPPDSVYHLIGVTLSEAGKPALAMEAYQKAIEKGQNAGSYFGMASTLAQEGKFEAASAAYAKGIELKPDTPAFMKMYADLLRDNGKRREALEMYRRSLAINPNNAAALLQAGVLSLKLQDRNAALAYLESLKLIEPALAKKLERLIRLRIWG